MAINFFRNVSVQLTTSPDPVYTAPVGFSAIVLMAQISNITGTTYAATMLVEDSGNTKSLITGFDIPANDALGVLTGKLVLEAGQSIVASASANSALDLVLSILESQN